jgi:dTDP-4-amino-4,6-dideoxygalactose transaminase
MKADQKPAQRRLGILGGSPLFSHVLGIVRPRFPPLPSFVGRFEAAMARGQVTNNGPAVVEFESKLSAYCGAPALAINNGQTALMIMLRAAGIESGDVIVPSYTFSATPHAVCWAGARPVFCDMKDMVIDPANVERRITPDTVGILAVDVYGLACDYGALEEIGRRHKIKVLFDSAPSFGTKVDGKPVGAHGDAQIFSFHATKALNTMEGGALVSRDSDIIRRAKALRNFGQSRGADCDEPGLNGKMMEIAALIGIEQLRDFDRVVEHRFRCTEMLRQGLDGVPGVSLTPVPAGQVPVWLYFPVVLDPQAFGMNRDVLAAALERENIHVRKYFEMPCHHMTCYKDQSAVVLPQTEKVAYNVVALPVYNDMTEAECHGITAAIRDIQQNAEKVVAAFGSARS